MFESKKHRVRDVFDPSWTLPYGLKGQRTRLDRRYTLAGWRGQGWGLGYSVRAGFLCPVILRNSSRRL